MKKITLLLGICLLPFFTSQAQSVIFEQALDGSVTIVSDYFNLGTATGIYSADDFELTSAAEIDSIKVYGGQDEGNLTSAYLTGFSLYIYANMGGIPAGAPTMTGTGILEIVNLPASSPALEIEEIHDGDPNTTDTYNFTVDIIAAQGTPLNLSPGIYWLVAVPHINVNFDTTTGGETERWNWGNSVQSTLSFPHLIDPDDKFGGGVTSWTEINNLGGPPMDALAFTVYGESLAITDQQPLPEISIYPNPVADILHLDLPASASLKSIALYDLLGRQIPVSFENNTMGLSKLSPGMYVLKLETSQGVLTRKIVKQ